MLPSARRSLAVSTTPVRSVDIESVELHLDRVGARDERREREIAGGVAGGHARVAGAFVAQRDRRADEHLARWVDGRPADLTGGRLSCGDPGKH